MAKEGGGSWLPWIGCGCLALVVAALATPFLFAGGVAAVGSGLQDRFEREGK